MRSQDMRPAAARHGTGASEQSITKQLSVDWLQMVLGELAVPART